MAPLRKKAAPRTPATAPSIGLFGSSFAPTAIPRPAIAMPPRTSGLIFPACFPVNIIGLAAALCAPATAIFSSGVIKKGFLPQSSLVQRLNSSAQLPKCQSFLPALELLELFLRAELPPYLLPPSSAHSSHFVPLPAL